MKVYDKNPVSVQIENVIVTVFGEEASMTFTR